MAGEVDNTISEDMEDKAAEDEDMPKEKAKDGFSLESILWTVRNTATR